MLSFFLPTRPPGQLSPVSRSIRAVPLTLLMVAGLGCTGSSSEIPKAAACSRAVELVGEMTEADSFSNFQLLAELNAELSTIEAPEEIAATIQRLHEATTQWITVLEGGNQDDESIFQTRDDVVESRLTLRRLCR